MERRMSVDDKELGLKVLDYWYTIEMLQQPALPRREERGYYGKISKISEHMAYDKEMLSALDEKVASLGLHSYGNITCYIGQIDRELCIEKLASLLGRKADSPEKSYDKIAWASLQFTNKGEYIENSFSLSPVLWAIDELTQSKKRKNIGECLRPEAYAEAIERFNEVLVQKPIVEKIELQAGYQNKNGLHLEVDVALRFPLRTLQNLQKKVWGDYITANFSEPIGLSDDVLLEYVAYPTQNPPENVEDNYTGLHMDFFSNDLYMVRSALQKNSRMFKDGMGKALLDYIVSAAHKDDAHTERMDLVPGRENPFLQERFHEILSEVLNVEKAPLGKWPSQFMPALMQQVAINLFCSYNTGNLFSRNTPVFSVNGPPGTGKTTLLKEIIVNNVVERAKLLAVYDNPEDAFERDNFEHGPEADHSYNQYVRGFYRLKNDKINDYGILVTSCNNAAVENISKELPVESGITASLSEQDPAQQKIRDLFIVAKSATYEDYHSKAPNSKKQVVRRLPDIYFSKYATDLLRGKNKNSESAWGLIAAALGKKENIVNFARCVLAPLVTEDFLKTNAAITERLVKWQSARSAFKAQLVLVQQLQANLEQQCRAEYQYSKSLLSYRQLQKAYDAIAAEVREFEGLAADYQKRNQAINQEIKEANSQYQKKGFLWFKKVIKNEFNQNLDRRIRSLQSEQAQIDDSLQKGIRSKKKASNYQQKLQGEQNKLSVLKNTCETYRNRTSKEQICLNEEFIEKFTSEDNDFTTKAQIANPWFTAEYNRQREKLFYLAMQVHKEFVLSSKACRTNFNNLLMIWRLHPDARKRVQYHPADRQKAMASLLQTLWLLVPVISSTFASVGRLLGDVQQPGALGTLIVDEAGQAQPQMAVGSLFRMRKAIIVGDPKQVEPVVTGDLELLKQSYDESYYVPYRDKRNSVQQFADQLNCFGTYLSSDKEPDEKEWVGCPLLVHRRCIDPMYSISNQISYNGIMKQQTLPPQLAKVATFACDKSMWLNIEGDENGYRDHFVKAQGDAVLDIIEKAFQKQPKCIPSIYIISPFTSVIRGIYRYLQRCNRFTLTSHPYFRTWLNKNLGTVHKFQGKEANEVIFLLGCDDSAGADGAIRWVNNNIVNVAVTRAKYRLCVIGNRKAWSKSACISKMMNILDNQISLK